MPAPLPPGRKPAKMRSIRVPDAPWQAAQDQAGRDGLYMSEAIVALLTAYGAGRITLIDEDPEPPPRKRTTRSRR